MRSCQRNWTRDAKLAALWCPHSVPAVRPQCSHSAPAVPCINKKSALEGALVLFVYACLLRVPAQGVLHDGVGNGDAVREAVAAGLFEDDDDG